MTTPLEQLDNMTKSLVDEYETITLRHNERMRLIGLLRNQLEAETAPKAPAPSTQKVKEHILDFFKKKDGWWAKNALSIKLGHSLEVMEQELNALVSEGILDFRRLDKSYSLVVNVKDVILKFLRNQNDGWGSFNLANRLGYSISVIEMELAALIQTKQVEYDLPSNTYCLTPTPSEETT